MADELICRVRKRLASGFEIDADLRAPLSQAPVIVLFGPSGSGKSTLLRLIAGLERPDSGEIAVGGVRWYDSTAGVCLDPQRRRTGFLFQEYALFPHLTVEENVGFAARAGAGKKALDAFGLAELAARRPRELSGGQQQRVALARALAAQPSVLLLDEPLSALDAPSRARLRLELRRALVSGGVPSILVTHDRTEAMALGDWLAVMVDGRIRQAGPVGDVFRRPVDASVAESVGVENILRAEVAGRRGGLLTLRTDAFDLQSVDTGDPGVVHVLACIRAEDIVVTRAAGAVSSARNRIAGRIASVASEGALARVELDCGVPLIAVITAQSAADLDLRPGLEAHAVVKTTAVHVIPA